MDDDDSKSLQFSQPPQKKTIRADIISNHKTIVFQIKFVILFVIMCYGSHLLPNAEIKIVYTPQKWSQIDVLDIKQISPLNRKIKVYISPANDSQQIDQVLQVEIYSLFNNQQKQQIFKLAIKDLDSYSDISQNQVKFYLGDINVLQSDAYRIKINKPMKSRRMLSEQYNKFLKNNKANLVSEKKKYIINEVNMQIKNKNQYNQTIRSLIPQNTTDVAQNKTEQQQKQKEEQQQKQKQQQQQKQKQQEEQKQKQQEEQKKRQQEQQKKRQQEQKKRQQEQQKNKKIQQHTNIKIQAHYVSPFATFLQLIIRYISILIIIYLSTDNPDAPKIIALICTLYSNPLLFLQLSFPNPISNIIQILSQSIPYLYLSIWLYYIHRNIKYTYPQQPKQKLFLIIKIILGIFLYLINIFRLLRYHVLIWQILIGIIVSSLLSLYIWEIFLNLSFQHHRDKVLIVITIAFIGYLFTFKTITGLWQDLSSYIIIQLYGFILIYLTGQKKNILLKNQKLAISSQSAHVKFQQLKQKS